MKKDMKLGVNLMSKSVQKEMIKEVIDREVKIEMVAADDLGKYSIVKFLFYLLSYYYTIRRARVCEYYV